MRALAAIAAALILVPAAAAAKSPPPPVGFDGLRIIKLKPVPKAKPFASCSVHSKSNTKVVKKAARRVLPVACEQPPKVNLTGASGVIQALFGH